MIAMGVFNSFPRLNNFPYKKKHDRNTICIKLPSYETIIVNKLGEKMW